MICVSIAEKTVEKCIEALEGIDFAEIRLDKMTFDLESVKKVIKKALAEAKEKADNDPS